MKTTIEKIAAFLIVSTAILLTVSCKKNDPEDNTPRMTFTTALDPGEEIRVSINVDEANREEVWIDLDNDKQRDENESFNDYNNNGFSTQVFTPSSKTVTIYGKVNVLDVNEQKLITLDVSKNTALTRLQCSYSQLTSLNVSGNKALESLDCAYNQLTSLDVSKNTALQTLWCHDNLLTSLNVSGSKSLTALYCDNNKLTSLDVSKAPALTDLRCSNNQLTSLDVSKNTALGELICAYNKIKEPAMKKLLTTLPNRTGKESGQIGVHWPEYGDYKEENHEPTQTEKNEILEPKNWRLVLGPG